MTTRRSRVLPLVAVSLCMSACVSPGIVEVAPDQYMLAKRDAGGIIGNSAALKARIIKESQTFAQSKGKRAVPVPLDEIPGWPTCEPGVVEYHFRTVDPALAAKQTTQHRAAGVDIYTELLKLDELRQRGLLTDAEFAEQKSSLLQAK